MKSYRVASQPPTRRLSCSPSTRLSFNKILSLRAAPPVHRTLHPCLEGRRSAGRLEPSPPSYATNTTYAPSLSARMTKCRSTATFSSELRHKYNVRSILFRKDGEVQVDYNPLFGSAPQVQCALHPYPQGRQGAGRLQLSPRSYTTSTTCAPSLSARMERRRSTEVSPSELHFKKYSE